MAGSLDSLCRELLLEFLLNPAATTLSVVCRVPNSCSNGTATQTLGVRPNLSNISLLRRFLLGMIGRSTSEGRAPVSTPASGRSTRMLTSKARSPSGEHTVPLMLSTNSWFHLSSELSCRTVLHLITSKGVPVYAWPSNCLQPRKIPWSNLAPSLLGGQDQEETFLAKLIHKALNSSASLSEFCRRHPPCIRSHAVQLAQ